MSRCRRAVRTGLLAAFTAALAAGFGPRGAMAQSVQARAVVIDGSLAMQRERDLDFQDVIRNSVVTVPVNSTQSGRLRITGPNGAGVTLQFFLPTALWVGAASLPISFNNTAGGESWQTNPRFATLFDPNTVYTTQLRPTGLGVLLVWLGGTVTVSPTQPPGVYTSPVTLVVSYTGS
jgi:hypothetical protein